MKSDTGNSFRAAALQDDYRAARKDDFRTVLREVRDEDPPNGLILLIETSKTIPLLYIILSLPSIDSYVCGLPRCMFEPPANGAGLAAFANVPGRPSAAMNFQVFQDLGYTDKQIMVLWILNSSYPDATMMFTILISEILTLGLFLFCLNRLHKRSFYFPALFLNAFLTLFWGCFELQTVRALHLWNTPFDETLLPIANRLNATHPQLWMDEKGVETVLCSVPFGAWTARAFAAMHFFCGLYYVYQLIQPECCYARCRKEAPKEDP